MKIPQWLRCATRFAGFALASLALPATPIADAQSVRSEPDFSGMNRPTDFFQMVARDGVRGWTYGLGGSTTHMNGIQVGAFSRVNDLGQVDLAWTGELATPFLRGTLLLGNGELMFRDGLLETSWHRLRQGPNGGFVEEPFRWTNEPLTQDNTFTTASDSQGNTYAVFNRLSGTGALLATLRRVSSDGVPDAAWRLDIDAVPNTLRQLAISADGSVFYVAVRTEGTSTINTLGRASASDTLRWSSSFAGTFSALATDAVGRAYVLGDKVALQGSVGTLLRIARTGNIDAGWVPLVEPASPNSIASVRLLDDRVVVVTASGTDQSIVRLLSLADGRVLASRVVPVGASVALVDTGGTVVLNGDSKLTLWSPTATDFEARDVAIKSGTAPIIASIMRWGAGYIVGGQFEFVYNAVRYAHLMRLGADLQPDPTWQPAVTGVVNALAVDRDGGLMVGGERLLDGHLGLIRFGADGRLDPRWRKSFNATVLTITAANDGDVFAGGQFGKVDDVNVSAIARFKADGALQAGWAQSVPWRQQPGAPFGGFSGDGVRKIIDAGDAGIVVSWQQTTGIFDFGEIKLSRFSRAAEGVILPNSGGLNAISQSAIAQDASSGQIFGLRYLANVPEIVRLLPSTLEIDPMWLPPVADGFIAAFSDTHLYLANGRRMLRSTHGATRDPDWTLGGRSIAGWLDTNTLGDGLTWANQGGAPLVIRSPSPFIAQRTAVEYFAKNVQRFFITARVSEQQSLDANPTQFARTGMQFGAFDGTVMPPKVGVIEVGPPPPLFRPDGALPICRFYAPPIRGGSNTHFYGRRTDCQLLNTYSAFVNEGYDFAAPPPSTSSGACPANASVPVYRLFNNLSASNNGNHRYVVSLARVAEMKAMGWLDEGVAFCATSAVDSRAFGRW